MTVERLRLGRALPLLGHDRKVRAERLRIGGRHFQSAHVRRNDHGLAGQLLRRYLIKTGIE